MNQVELLITVTKTDEGYCAKMEGVKRPHQISGEDKMKCIEKCINRIRNKEIFDIVIKDET